MCFKLHNGVNLLFSAHQFTLILPIGVVVKGIAIGADGLGSVSNTCRNAEHPNFATFAIRMHLLTSIAHPIRAPFFNDFSIKRYRSFGGLLSSYISETPPEENRG